MVSHKKTRYEVFEIKILLFVSRGRNERYFGRGTDGSFGAGPRQWIFLLQDFYRTL